MNIVYEIRTTLSITYSFILFCLSVSSMITSLILLYQTIMSLPFYQEEWSLSLTILYAQSIFSFFNGLLSLITVLQGVWVTCCHYCRSDEDEIFMI